MGLSVFFFLLFRVGLWPRTWSLFLQVPRACAPFFLAIPGGLSGAALSQQRLGFAHGWCTWLWVGSDGCGEGGGKMPLPVFLLFWLCVFCLSPGVLLFFACGGNRPCHHSGSAGFWGGFFLSVSLFFACLGWRVAVFWEQRGPPPLPPLVLSFVMGGTCCPC